MKIADFNDSLINTIVETTGRVHKIRQTGNICFMILRDGIHSIQTLTMKKTNKTTFDTVIKQNLESYVKVTGILTKIPDNYDEIKFTSHKRFELIINAIETISNATETLPLVIDDINNFSNVKYTSVMLNTRLNNRTFELRTPINNSIFKLRSAFCKYFRRFMDDNNYTEIQTPKIIGSPSEGGSSTFKVKYFEDDAYLAQSPQLYKQICINADFERVYEIGPVFRAENSTSHRHLCEFTGLDIEMAIEKDYHEIINMFWRMLVYVLNQINKDCTEILNYIKSIHNFDEIKISPEPLIIQFIDGVRMLNDAGYQQNPYDDLSSANEQKLGELVKQKYGYDIFVLDKYPLHIRPFYTHPSEDGLYSYSYDVIMRGQEIASGAQRIHEYNQLMKSVIDNKLNPQYLHHYLESFKYGARPHGGCGFGLERIIMLLLDLDDVRQTSLFPRDPKRITP